MASSWPVRGRGLGGIGFQGRTATTRSRMAGVVGVATCGWFGSGRGRGGGRICRRHSRGSGTEHATATTGTVVLIFTTPQEDPASREGIAEL